MRHFQKYSFKFGFGGRDVFWGRGKSVPDRCTGDSCGARLDFVRGNKASQNDYFLSMAGLRVLASALLVLVW
jgi:hypothetical protein